MVECIFPSVPVYVCECVSVCVGESSYKTNQILHSGKARKARFFLALLPRDNDFTLPLLRQHKNQALEARGRKSCSGGGRRQLPRKKIGGGLAVVVNFRVKKKKNTHSQTNKQRSNAVVVKFRRFLWRGGGGKNGRRAAVLGGGEVRWTEERREKWQGGFWLGRFGGGFVFKIYIMFEWGGGAYLFFFFFLYKIILKIELFLFFIGFWILANQ